MEFNIPVTLHLEHEELHAVLSQAIEEPGRLGESAKNVAKILHPHFQKEEQFALPPLGLLSALANGNMNAETPEVLVMTNKLKNELPQMLEEHKSIVAALASLSIEANKVGKLEYVSFADKLALHARNEEEVLYPAAILIGDYVKLKLRRQRRKSP